MNSQFRSRLGGGPYHRWTASLHRESSNGAVGSVESIRTRRSHRRRSKTDDSSTDRETWETVAKNAQRIEDLNIFFATAGRVEHVTQILRSAPRLAYHFGRQLLADHTKFCSWLWIWDCDRVTIDDLTSSPPIRHTRQHRHNGHPAPAVPTTQPVRSLPTQRPASPSGSAREKYPRVQEEKVESLT